MYRVIKVADSLELLVIKRRLTVDQVRKMMEVAPKPGQEQMDITSNRADMTMDKQVDLTKCTARQDLSIFNQIDDVIEELKPEDPDEAHKEFLIKRF
jgi:hypothetical protein